jgi:hypothetical protein
MGQNYVPYDSGIYNDVVQVKRSGDEIQMIAKSCDILKSEAQAIKLWSKKSSANQERPAVCKCLAGSCSMNVAQIVPDFVKEVQGVCPANAGPNCLNTTLHAVGLVTNLRYTTASEMGFWLDSPLCSEKTPGEPKKPGDIVVFKEGKSLIHAFIHVSKNLAFSRNGSRTYPYTFQSPETGYEVYGVKKGCEDQYQTPADDKGCRVWTNTYSCISMEEYLKRKPITNKEQIEALKVLEANECSLSTQAFAKNIDKSLLDLTRTSLMAIQKLAEKRLQSSNSAEEKFIWENILVKTDANYSQYLLLSY